MFRHHHLSFLLLVTAMCLLRFDIHIFFCRKSLPIEPILSRTKQLASWITKPPDHCPLLLILVPQIKPHSLITRRDGLHLVKSGVRRVISSYLIQAQHHHNSEGQRESTKGHRPRHISCLSSEFGTEPQQWSTMAFISSISYHILQHLITATADQTAAHLSYYNIRGCFLHSHSHPMFTYVVYEDHILGLRYSIICDAVG